MIGVKCIFCLRRRGVIRDSVQRGKAQGFIQCRVKIFLKRGNVIKILGAVGSLKFAYGILKLREIMRTQIGSVAGCLLDFLGHTATFIDGADQISVTHPGSFLYIYIQRPRRIRGIDLLLAENQSAVYIIFCHRALLYFIRGNMLRRHVGENVKYQIDKNNNKNDHSDIDIKRLAIANHFFIFTQKMPHLFSNSTFLFYHFQPRKTTF